MAKRKTVTVAQFARMFGLKGKVGQEVAKAALAQMSKPAGPNGKNGAELVLRGMGRRKRPLASGKVLTVGYRWRNIKGVRKVKSPASRSSLGRGRIRDAVVKASIGD